jgi:hypothetical protein
VTVLAPVIATVQVRLSAETVVQPYHAYTTLPGAGSAVSATDVAGVVAGTFATVVATGPVLTVSIA